MSQRPQPAAVASSAQAVRMLENQLRQVHLSNPAAKENTAQRPLQTGKVG
jgi:hypothetical protein